MSRWNPLHVRAEVAAAKLHGHLAINGAVGPGLLLLLRVLLLGIPARLLAAVGMVVLAACSVLRALLEALALVVALVFSPFMYWVLTKNAAYSAAAQEKAEAAALETFRDGSRSS
ncbi:hypothetical protein ACOTHJ_12945 [Achromobacter xylosoxidans]